MLQLTERQIEIVKQAVEELDGKSRGRVVLEKILYLFRVCGNNPTEDEMQRLLRSRQGPLDVAGVCQLLQMHLRPVQDEEEALQKALKALDKDGTGTISQDRLKEALTGNGSMSRLEVDELIAAAGTEKGEEVSCEALARLLSPNNGGVISTERIPTPAIEQVAAGEDEESQMRPKSGLQMAAGGLGGSPHPSRPGSQLQLQQGSTSRPGSGAVHGSRPGTRTGSRPTSRVASRQGSQHEGQEAETTAAAEADADLAQIPDETPADDGDEGLSEEELPPELQDD